MLDTSYVTVKRLRLQFHTKKPSDPLTLICALMFCTLFMIFFWWPTSVIPNSVSSFTVKFTTASIVLMPPAWKFSKYLVIFIEFSHSSTDVKFVKSGASADRGFVELQHFIRSLSARQRNWLISVHVRWKLASQVVFGCCHNDFLFLLSCDTKRKHAQIRWKIREKQTKRNKYLMFLVQKKKQTKHIYMLLKVTQAPSLVYMCGDKSVSSLWVYVWSELPKLRVPLHSYKLKRSCDTQRSKLTRESRRLFPTS